MIGEGLTHVPVPVKKKDRIPGLARKTRPSCAWCGKPLRRFRWADEDWAKAKKLEWGGYGDGQFCGLRCGYRWGLHMRTR